jgi:hypothetical protein
MTDELLMRRWTAAHGDFSSGLDRGLLRLGHFLTRRHRHKRVIDKPYARATRADAAEPEMNATARAALAGVLACVATTALLGSLAAVFRAETVDHVAVQAAVPTGSAIVAHAILA